MLDNNFNIKIIDFGDARRINEPISDESKEEVDARPSFVGTVNYQAPEMIEGGEQGHPLDIWALACILFKMLTGFVPFKGTNP